MSIDAKDYEPRPADDHFAGVNYKELKTNDCRRRWNSMIIGLTLRYRKWHPCHQLGCNFNDLPHG